MSKKTVNTKNKQSISETYKHVKPDERLLNLAKFLDSDGSISGSGTTNYSSDIDLLFTNHYLQTKSGKINYENILSAFVIFKTLRCTPCAIKQFLKNILSLPLSVIIQMWINLMHISKNL